jgi:large subunit ribosomal protein L15
MATELSNLAKPAGATKGKIRVGRGVGSGFGKTAGRGQKGQYARTRGFKPHFEGGQTPIQRRLPKRGFTQPFPAIVAEVNVGALDEFPAGAKIDETSLRDRGLIKGRFDRIKILGNGDLSKAVTITADSFSKGAVAKIEKAGGKAVVQSRVAASRPGTPSGAP